MAQMTVVTWPAKVLETKADPVSVFDHKLAQLAQDMHATMDHAGGIGLAANQVGVLKRVITIYIPFENQPSKPWHKKNMALKEFWHDRRYTFVNPKIVSFKGRHTSMEGCLSFPGQMDYVNRHVTITVDYQDLSGRPQSIVCDGLMSVCLQHEIDHINGTLFLERMNQKSAEGIKEKMLEVVMD
ncbi:MAG: peptide deformylase [Proteobacteria bacterium]|nr:peptide deformylase [Pseudomonadota bacterium]